MLRFLEDINDQWLVCGTTIVTKLSDSQGVDTSLNIISVTFTQAYTSSAFFIDNLTPERSVCNIFHRKVCNLLHRKY